jgi:hypothetical protein
MLYDVSVPGRMEIALRPQGSRTWIMFPPAVIVVSGMEWLVDVADEVGQNPDGELFPSLGLMSVSKNVPMARDLCRGAPSIRTVLAVRLPKIPSRPPSNSARQAEARQPRLPQASPTAQIPLHSSKRQ